MHDSRPELQVLSSLDPASLKAGECEPLHRLLAQLRPELLRFAQWLARDRVLAEDIVQEALLRAWRARDNLKDPTASKAWLLTIVRREHARLYERRRLELVSLEESIEQESLCRPQQPDDEVNGLRRAILLLPLEYREPLVMQVLGGFSTAEIASELKLSMSAVLTRLFRARNKLREIYGLRGVPDTEHGAAP
jgi:RNA polymerase sigma-70 factor (ECF subfamily)